MDINNPDNLPVIPKLPEPVTVPQAPDGAIAICGECGLRLFPVMGYVCGRSRCPTGLGGSVFLSNEGRP